MHVSSLNTSLEARVEDRNRSSTADLASVTASTMKISNTPTEARGGEFPAKKKLGRPRKNRSNDRYGNPVLALPAVPSPIAWAEGGGSGDFLAKQNVGMPRNYHYNESCGNPIVAMEVLHAPTTKRARKDKAILASSSGGRDGTILTPHVISVYAGQNVVEKIKSFGNGRRGVIILGALGTISSATIRLPFSSHEISLEGRFKLLTLSGSLIKMKAERPIRVTDNFNLTVSIVQQDMSLIGGHIAGRLIAASLVRVTIGTFLPSTSGPHDIPLQRQTQSQNINLSRREPSFNFEDRDCATSTFKA